MGQNTLSFAFPFLYPSWLLLKALREIQRVWGLSMPSTFVIHFLCFFSFFSKRVSEKACFVAIQRIHRHQWESLCSLFWRMRIRILQGFTSSNSNPHVSVYLYNSCSSRLSFRGSLIYEDPELPTFKLNRALIQPPSVWTIPVKLQPAVGDPFFKHLGDPSDMTQPGPI